MGLWTDVVGTVRGYIRLGLTGVRLKNSSGTLAVRNAGDSADAGASCGALTLSDKLTFADSSVLNSSPSGQFKNKIIGGDFTTNPWQRGTSFAAASSGYTADRWVFDKFSSGVVATIAKTADAPTAAQAGIFSQHCLHIDITTADTSIAAGDGCIIEQRIEGYNAACFGFGQSGTRYVTLSFWVKSTKTGTFCVALQNSDQTRAYVAEYTVNATDTWEKKSITIPVDTTGTWLYDSGTGVSIVFALAAGSSLQTTGGSWQTVSGATIATSNQVNALDSVNNNFKLDLVQLEAGSVATPFETRHVGQELALCQRYYQKTFDLDRAPATNTGDYNGALVGLSGGGVLNTQWHFAVPIRTGASVSTLVTTYNPAAANSNWHTGEAATVSTGVCGNRGVYIFSAATANTYGTIHATVNAEL